MTIQPNEEARIDTLLDAMSLDEQVALLAGADFWSTVPVERLDIPAVKVTDGPNGARGGGSLVGGVKTACFPAGVALASTWDTALVEEAGRALGQEALDKGARVLLAPTVNIHRSPLNGRNFECYSEDPHLSARIGVAYIRGVQSQRVAATIKHFAGNESEFERATINSEIGERALREIYLPPFEAAVREAGVWAVMAAYNRLNGTYASEHPRLLTELLRGEWGFDGLVMSDWFATHSTAAAAQAGLDLEMPGPTRHRGRQLVAAVRDGLVSAKAIYASARQMLRLLARVGAFEQPGIPEEQAVDRPEHRALIRRAGAEGAVLLKNSGVLPLDPRAPQTLAVIGPNAAVAQIMGGGSAQVNAHYRISPLEGIAAQVGPEVTLGHAVGCTNYRMLPLLDQTFEVDYFNSPDLSGPPVASGQSHGGETMWLHDVPAGVERYAFSARLRTRFTPAQGGRHLFSLVSAGLSRLLLDGQPLVDNWEGWRPGDSYFGTGSAEAAAPADLAAGQSYELTVEYTCPTGSAFGVRAVRVGVTRPLGEQELEQAAALAAAADAALVFVGLSGEWDTEGSDRPHMDLVGRQNELVARVAAANPRTVVVLQTGGPVAMPWLADVAAVLQAWYPGQECGNAIADVLFGAVNPSGRLPQSFPARLEDNPAFLNYPGENGRVVYGEGLFVGYRYYDKKQIAPLFPFGFGLSYTTFAYGQARLSAESLAPGGELTVTINITNTGERAGRETVQLYVRDPQARLARPPKELKGFAKVALAPGETKTVALTLDMRALAYYDDAQAAWVADAGQFEVLLGSSAQDIRSAAAFTLESSWSAPVKSPRVLPSQ
jgi:beta-glucosidase